MREIIIIGSGPAGYTAAIYAARAGLQPLVLASSVEAGGELMNTTEVENFPGFPSGVQGPELMNLMQQQAEKFGAEVILDDVTSVDLTGDVKKVSTGYSGDFESKSVIVATGSAYRKLGLPDEERLSGRGVSWCATCDGFFFKGKTIAVVGGGDSAMEEATFLTRFAEKVYLVHRKNTLRASRIMQERAFTNDKIEFVWDSEIAAIRGENAVESLVLRNVVSGVESELEVQGLFVAIGNDPRVHLFHGQLDLTESGTLKVDGRSSKTSATGVFAAGDVIDDTYRQAVTAAASGTVAALDAQHFLEALDQLELEKAEGLPLQAEALVD